MSSNAPGPDYEPTEREIFFAALEQSDSIARAAYVEHACRHDPELRRRVDALLANHSDGDSFMAGPAANGMPAKAALFSPPAEQPDGPRYGEVAAGDRIGRYKLLQKIGEGGMGTVWMAEQEEPVRRKVALKIIKLGMDTRDVIARFEAERQALAMMDHPNIARILDAGATGEGRGQRTPGMMATADFPGSTPQSAIGSSRPYFVMELVPGIRLTDYCDQSRLTIRERLKLFTKVCHAVQHAHQKGVIHRDLKSSNILVTLHDGVPVPKVIDFGIAKATAQRLTDKTLFTQLGAVLGTPAYMSPEQAELSGLDIDTRSDIYSLGVLLYELLTGKPPFDAKELIAAGVEQMLRTIREKEPPTPSARLTRLAKEDLGRLAQRHGTQAPQMMNLIRGDLDWIVMKCLEKDRRRRYESASALSGDIQHHLQNEPVNARPPSTAYRLEKFVRRNRLVVSAASAVAMALLAGLVTSGWLAVRAARQRDRAISAETTADQRRLEAVEQSAVKQRVLDFLVDDLLRQADSRQQMKSGETADPQLTVKEAARRAAAKIETKFTDKPAEEAAVRNAIGIAFLGTGEPGLAVPQLERSLALLKDLHGASGGETLQCMGRLAEAYNGDGQFKNAVALGESILQFATNGSLAPDGFVLIARTHLAQAYANAGQLPKAANMMEEILQAHTAGHGTNDIRTVRSQLNLAGVYALASRYRDAIPLLNAVRRQQQRQLLTNSMEMMIALRGMATAYGQLNQPETALPLFQEAEGIARSVIGSDHVEALSIIEGLARTYEQMGRSAEAHPLVEQVVRGLERKLGADHHRTLRAEARLASMEFRSGKKSAGIERLERVLARQKASKNLGPNDYDTLESMSLLGRLYSETDRALEATALFKEGMERSRSSLGPAHKVTRHLQLNLALNYLDENRLEEGGALFADAFRIEREQGQSDSSETASLIRRWVPAYERGRRLPAAVILQQVLVNGLRQTATNNPIEIATESSRLGRLFLGQKKFIEAEPVLDSALTIFRTNAPEHWRRFVTQAMLGSVLAGRGDFGRAETLLKEAQSKLQDSESAGATYKRDVLARVGRLYEAWNEAAPDPARSAQATEWKQKLADFDKHTTNLKPGGPEP